MKYFVNLFFPQFVLEWYYNWQLSKIKSFCRTRKYPVSAYLVGSFAFGDYVYGKSDLDLILVVQDSQNADQLYKELFHFIPTKSKLIQFQEISNSILSLDPKIEKVIASKKEFYQIYRQYTNLVWESPEITQRLKRLNFDQSFLKIGEIDFFRTLAENLISLDMQNKVKDYSRKLKRLKSLGINVKLNGTIFEAISAIESYLSNNETKGSTKLNFLPIKRDHNFLGPLIWNYTPKPLIKKKITNSDSLLKLIELTDYHEIVEINFKHITLLVGQQNFFLRFSFEKDPNHQLYKKRLLASEHYYHLFQATQKKISDYYLLSKIDDLLIFNQEMGVLFHSCNSQQLKTSLKISVCICTKNRFFLLDKLLQTITKQSKQPYEVIIIDNMSEDETESIADNYKTDLNLKYYQSSLNTISKLRNLAISKSHGDIVTFIDDDCEVPKDWLKQIEIIFSQDPKIGLVGGVVRHFDETELKSLNTFHREYLGAKK